MSLCTNCYSSPGKLCNSHKAFTIQGKKYGGKCNKKMIVSHCKAVEDYSHSQKDIKLYV